MDKNNRLFLILGDMPHQHRIVITFSYDGMNISMHIVKNTYKKTYKTKILILTAWYILKTTIKYYFLKTYLSLLCMHIKIYIFLFTKYVRHIRRHHSYIVTAFVQNIGLASLFIISLTPIKNLHNSS